MLAIAYRTLSTRCTIFEVLVLLTVTHEETINSIKHQIASFRETINARWIFAHISAIFCSIDEFGECDSIGNAESVII